MRISDWSSDVCSSDLACRTDDFSGFCLYDEEFPIIYVNNSSAKTRQIFTYFHELAHLVFHTSGIDKVRDRYIERLAGDSKQVEILCNSFAAQFLLPEDAFARAVAGRQANEATAEAVAAQFHVSREVVFRRRSEERRVGKECVGKGRSRWWRYH